MARAAKTGSRVDTALLVLCGLLALVVSVLPIDVREAIASGLRRTVVAPLVTLQTQAERGRSAFLSREATATKVDSLALRTMQLAELERENERLRSVIGLAAQLQWGFVPAEALHSRVPGRENTILLTAGRKAGVKQFSPVVAREGLVGMVNTVDENTSSAITWTHTDFRVSAMSADGSAFGIVNAHLGGRGQSGSVLDPERYLLEMRGVAFRSALKPGTVVVSSGLGGVYQRGIPIGTVLGEIKTSEAWTRTYLLRPVVSPPDVTTVTILSPERASADVQTVWTSAAAADSAARRIAAAGDSLARLGTAAAAAARRQLLDSTSRTDSVRGGRALPEATPFVPRDTTRRDTTRPRPRPDTPRRVRPDTGGRP
jgi:rod shape-determining protein MreC